MICIRENISTPDFVITPTVNIELGVSIYLLFYHNRYLYKPYMSVWINMLNVMINRFT